MKFKIKEKPEYIYSNEFLIFPREYNGYRYWLCWVTVQYQWLGFRYQRFGDIICLGRKAKQGKKAIKYID